MTDKQGSYQYYDVDEFFTTFGAAITRDVWLRRREAIINLQSKFKVYDDELAMIKANKAEQDAQFTKYNPQSK